MAKKLNTKIVIILLVLAGLGALAAAGLGFYYLRERNPEYCLQKAQHALENNDYKTAERYFGRACGVARSNQEKIANYFRFAEFQLLDNEHHVPDWTKALGCWNTVLKIDPKNGEALRKLFDYFYEIADLGQTGFWKQVQEYSESLLEIQEENNLPVDPKVLLARGRSHLEIARAGGTTNRQELLDQAVADFQRYLEIKPDDENGYLYLADCALVKGTIEVSQGNLQAMDASRREADRYLEEAIKITDDKAAAWANRFQFQLRTMTDPNQIQPIRQELEDLTKTLPASGSLYEVLATSYERSGPLGREEELSRAIRAMRQAVEIEPENVRHLLRLATLLHHKGSIYRDSALLAEALSLAEKGLKLPDAVEKPGPRQFYARGNQYALLSLVAQIHVETILDTRRDGGQIEDLDSRMQAIRSAVDKITQIIGSAENPTIQKWQGLITLAEGDKVRGIRQLYRAYEQFKALDQPEERSQIDPLLCYVLAEEMADRNVFGMQKEFLEKALFNRNSISNWKPKAWIDYAKLLLISRNFREAVMVVSAYENAFGSSPETREIRLRSYIEAGFTEEAETIISALDPDLPETQKLQLLLINKKILNTQIRLSNVDESAEPQDSQEQIRAELDRMQDQKLSLFLNLLASDKTLADRGLLAVTCQQWLQEGRIESARTLASAGLTAFPEETGLVILSRQLAEPDPKSISDEKVNQITEDAIKAIEDPRRRGISLARYYQSQGRPSDALEIYSGLAEENAEDAEIVGTYYELLLNQKQTDRAEQIARQARDKNLDGCEGSFYAARLEMARDNYDLALRRLDECLTYRPMFPQAWLLKSRIFNSQDDLQSALEAAATANRMNPLNPEIVLHYASLLHTRNVRLGNRVTDEQAREAERFMLSALVLNPGNRNLQSFYAEIMYQRDPDKAMAMRQQLLRNEASLSNAIFLGNMAMRRAREETHPDRRDGFFEVAGEAYQQALAIAPDNKDVVNAYSEYMRLTGRSEQAEALLDSQPDVLWRFYLRDGQYDKAEAILLSLRSKQPDDQQLLRGLIQAAQGKGDRQALRGYLDILLPMATTADEELWALQQYLEFEFTESIEDQIASFRERHPDNIHVLLLEAWYHMSRGRLDEALSELNQFLASNTEHAGAWRLRGRIYRLLGDYPKAINDVLRSKTLDPAPSTRIELANIYLENGQAEAAIGELRSGLEDAQAPMQLRSMLENIYEQRNRVSDLRTFYRETLEKYPTSVYWQFRLGKFLHDQKDYTRAEAALSKAWELSREQGLGDPRTLDYYLETLLLSKSYNNLLAFAAEHIDTPFAPILYTYIAQTHLELGQKEKAAQNFFTALDKTGTNLDLMGGIISVIVEKTGPDTIVQWCQDKLRRNPESIEGLLVAISLHEKLGQYNQALQYIDTCLELLDPKQNQWLMLSLKKANMYTMAYAQTADEEYLNQSIALMEQIIEIMPYNYTAMNNLAYLLANNNQQLDKALSYARKACQNNLGNPVFLDTYAFIQCLLGEYKDAYTSLLRAIQLHEARNEPVPWEVYKHLGMAQEGMGKTQEAVQAYERSIGTAGIPAKEKQELEKKILTLIQL